VSLPVVGEPAQPGFPCAPLFRSRVVFHERPASGDGPTVAGPYARREWQVGADEVVDLCRALLQADEAAVAAFAERRVGTPRDLRSEEHTSELQSRENLVCRHLLE